MIVEYVRKLLRSLCNIFRQKPANTQKADNSRKVLKAAIRPMTDNERSVFTAFVGEMSACINCKHFIASCTPPQIISRGDKLHNEVIYVGICNLMKIPMNCSDDEYLKRYGFVQWDYCCGRFEHKSGGKP